MWALRRASFPLRNKNGLRLGASQSHFADSELPMNLIHCTFECSHVVRDGKGLSLRRFYCRQTVCGNADLLKREFSSRSRVHGIGSDFQDDFFDLGMWSSSETESENEDGDDDNDDDDDNGDDNVVEPSRWEEPTTELFRAITGSKGISIREAVDKWVAEGNELTHKEILLTTRCFRKHGMIRTALELSDCLVEDDKFESDERIYASRVDLIARVHGVKMAEAYIEMIPDSYRGGLVYQNLLAHCSRFNKVKKAEEVFQKLRDLGFPVTLFSCNHLLFLYKRCDKKKIADVLQLMVKENVKPSARTYKVLMGIRSPFTDYKRAEEILEFMKSDGIQPDIQARFIMARQYLDAGLKDKAEALLKEMEGNNLEENRWVCHYLLSLYGQLEKADEVERIWNICKTDPHLYEGMAAITAWGKLKKVEKAEAVFDWLLKRLKKPSHKIYTKLLTVYADNKQLAKGENLVKRMTEGDLRTGPLDWHSLVRLYLDAGEVEKADHMFMKFSRQRSMMRPLFNSYMDIMKEYAKRGDIRNSEKMFLRIKQAGFSVRSFQFEHLINAYINAKKPAYGIWERLKAENLSPSPVLNERLRQVDPFRTTPASYLLD